MSLRSVIETANEIAAFLPLIPFAIFYLLAMLCTSVTVKKLNPDEEISVEEYLN